MHIFRFLRYRMVARQTQCQRSDSSMGKFKIPTNPPTVNKTIRFPNDVVVEVEKAIKGRDCTFSAFVIAAVRAALQDLKQ